MMKNELLLLAVVNGDVVCLQSYDVSKLTDQQIAGYDYYIVINMHI